MKLSTARCALSLMRAATLSSLEIRLAQHKDLDAPHLPIDIETVKGFLDPEEGAKLYALAARQAPHGLCVEIGSYCGKSTVYIGTACQSVSGVLLAIDHHYGSEENQPGEEYFDPDLADPDRAGMSSLRQFRDTMRKASLEDCVIPVLSPSGNVARVIHGPIAFVFIDGGHSQAAAISDYRNWAGKLMPGGILAIHDVFPNPADGGRPPHNIYKTALHSELFTEEQGVKSLRVLRRL